MNHFYKTGNNNKRGFSKKFFLLLVSFIAIFATVNAQVEVSGTTPVSGPTPYPTLKAAFDAVNAGAHQGVITIVIKSNTTEIATAILNGSSLPSNYSSVTITTNAVGRIVTGNLATGIVKLNGADNVTINGDVAGVRGLTFSNINATTTSGVIWVASASISDGANNNSIQNCIVTGNTGTTTGAVIGQSSGITFGGVAETANSNNSYTGNLITTGFYGIKVAGPSASPDNNTSISNNTISTAGHGGIYMSNQQNLLVSKNTISAIASTTGSFTFQTSGIIVLGTITGGLIEKNNISNVRIASVWGCNGIQLDATNTNTGLVIANNFIYDIASGGYSGYNTIDDNAMGIGVNKGGGYKIHFNSIDMSTNFLTSSGNQSAALWIGAGITAGTLVITNNIFANRLTTGTRYAIYSNSPSNTIFATINNNDYFSTGSVGFLGAIQAGLGNWQVATEQDDLSVSVNPFYTSTSNLHLLGNSPLDMLATPVAGITTDIDGDTRNATIPDIGADEFTPPNCSNPVINNFTATASVTDICASGSAILTSSGYSFGVGIGYMWQVSTTGLPGSWTDMGLTNPLSASTGVISATRYYRLRVRCNGDIANEGYSVVITINVNNPTAIVGPNVARCGIGTVDLTATGTNLKWYAAASGGSVLGTGSPFTTPVISTTTNFYVSSSTGAVSGTGGKLAPTLGAGYNGTTGLVFDATQPFRIDSVKMYPQASGSVTIQAVTSGGLLITGCTYTANFTGPAPGGVFVPLNFQIPVGTAHRLVVSNNANSIIIWRDFTGNTYPYILGTVGSITSGYISGISQTYYYFFDWHFSTGCESTRMPITAIVNTPPAFTSVSPAAGAPRTICTGSSVTLNAVGGGYTNYTWNPGALPNGSVVSPLTTTTYTLTGDIPPNGCRRDSLVTITVNSTPTPLTIIPANVSICPNLCYTVTTSGGLIPGQSIFSENGETFPLTTFTLTGSAVTLNQNTNYYQQGTKSIHLTHGNSANGSIETANIPLTGFTNPSLTFYQIAGLDASSIQHRDVGYVEFSTDGGSVWTKFPASSYAGSGTLYNQYQDVSPAGVGFDNTSYPDWDAQFTGTGSNVGISPGTSLWKLETINLSAYQGFANFKIRFRILASASGSYYGWLIDNIRITATGQAPVTWNSNTNLFTTCAHLTNIGVNSGNFPAPIYWTGVNAAPVTYTATATGGVGCTTSATVTISATGVTPDVTIAANPPGPICAGTSVTFTASPVNGGAGAAYNWKVNNATVSGGSQVGMTTITLSSLSNLDNVTCVMSVVPNFCFPGGTLDTSNAIQMTVNPNPIANNITGGTGNTVCTGAPNLLTETATGIITNYQWLLGISPVGGNSSTYSAIDPGSYTAIVTSNQGCKDTSAPFVVTQPTYTITATAGPNGTVSPIGTVVVDCGDNITFTITPNPGYSITDVLIDGVTNPGAIASGTYTFTNVLANGHTIHATFGITGCGSPATSYAGPNATICSGVNFTLSGLRSIGGSGITSGTWTTSGSGTFNLDNTFAGATSYTPSPNDINNGTVNLTLTTNTPPLPCLPSSSTMTLTIKRSPAVTITGQIGLCTVGATTTWLVADTSATITNVTGFQWYHPLPTPIGGATNDSLNVTAVGSYSVIVNGANGCTGTNTVAVGILPTPTINISGTGPICTDAGVDINATATTTTGTINPTGFTWYNPGVISGANVSILTATAAGTYSATATNSYGCISAMSGGVTLALDNSPLIGDYTIGVGPASCTNYLSFATAINDLNTRSISGDVRFSVPGGYTETLNSPGLVLGGTLIAGIPQLNNATNGGFTISFFKSGAGANPLLTAFPGGTSNPASAIPDGMFKLRGVNNVSITEIDLTENAANSGNSLMEFGYGIFKYTAADGAQNNLIQSCTITLNKANSALASSPMSEGATGIILINATDNNATAAHTPSSAAGTNSNNKFYGNTITNCHNGIWLSGNAAISPFTIADLNNDIGGTAGATGNFITNFGNAGDATGPNGIRIINQWNVNASYNTINNNDGAGSNTTNSMTGINGTGGTSASATISSNSITLNSNAPVGQSVIAIDNGIGSTAASNTVIINSNTITGSSLLATNAPWTGIRNTASAATVTISGNTVQNVTLAGTGASSIFTGISNTITVPVLNVNNNNITGNTKTGVGVMNGISLSTPTVANIISNVISDNTIAGGGTACTLYCIIGGGPSYTLDGNTFYNNSITNMSVGFVGTIIGYNNVGGSTSEVLTDNVIRKLFVTGAAGSAAVHSIRGLSNNTAGGSVRAYLRNSIDSLYTNGTASGAIIGIWTQAGGNVSIGNNKIHSLFPGQGGGASTAKGINVQAGTLVKVYNNIISLDLSQAFAPASNNVLTGATAVSGIEVNGGTTVNIYYNTVRLAGGGGAGFGSSCIYLFNVTPVVDIRNNIFTSYMTPGTGGIAAGLRRITAGMAGYASTSNNNLWYTTGTTTTPVYYNGTSYNTLAAFKAGITAPREAASIDDNPVFVNTALNDLHLAPNNCNINGAAAPIAGYTDDYDTNLRDASLPDIGMDEFIGTGAGFTWKGLNTDWLNAANWCGGVPTATDDVVIPGGKNFYPVIISAAGLAVAHNIDLNPGGSITVSNGGVLSNTGSWTNNGTLTNDGMIVLNGAVNQSFPGGGSGTMPSMDSLVVDNAGGATFNKAFTLTGMLKPKAGNISVNDVVTLHSDMSGTARVDTVMGSFSYGGPGKFIVERYISTLEAAVPHTGWRFLGIPTNTTETINQAWMEGQTPNNYLGTGYGTIIVGPGGTAVGFDQATSTPSMKTHAQATNTWVSVPGTSIPIATTEGYMIFLRGDRAASTFGSANSTTLRTRGPIRTGNVIVSTANANTNKFMSVGNPYPSAISFSSISTSKVGLQNTYYLWDPKLSTYGAYQTFSGPSFIAVPGGGSYGGTPHNAIESGQAFFVVSNGTVTPHSITITENSKVSSNYQVARMAGASKQFSTRMYLVSGSGLSLYDGNRVDFDPAYSNVIDDEDALKMSNFGENIGILRDGKTLSIERRGEIIETDTIFYQFGQLRQQEYQLEFTPENLASPILTAYLEDAYLHSTSIIDLNVVSTVNFTVNADAGSRAPDRFRIVFRQLGPVPLSFITVTANRQDKDVLVGWKVANELNIAQYEVEHSADGRNFGKIGTEAARGNGNGSTLSYNWLDVHPFTGYNYYRIKSIGISNETKYSETVKINMAADAASIAVYPNPVQDGMIGLTFNNQPAGDYTVKLFAANGQLIWKQVVIHAGGSQRIMIPLAPALAKGIYNLQVYKPGGKHQAIEVNIE